MVSTDAGNYLPGQGHPQAAASFPRFFRMLVRESGLLSWPEAVRRATLLPAETMGLKTKGRLREGMDADLTVFDMHEIADRRHRRARRAARGRASRAHRRTDRRHWR